MAIHTGKSSKYVDSEGRNPATVNKCRLTLEPTKKDLAMQNAPTTLELLRMGGKLKNSRDKNTSRGDKSVWARHSGDQAIGS